MIENRRAVLRAHIATLPVQRGRVMQVPKPRQDLLSRDFLRIVDNFDRLGVARGSGAYIVVGGIGLGPASIAGSRGDHPIDAAVGAFDAPEASGGDGDGLGAFW